MRTPGDDRIAAEMLREWQMPVTPENVTATKRTYAFAVRRLHLAGRTLLVSIRRGCRK